MIVDTLCKENQPEFKRDNDRTREYRARILDPIHAAARVPRRKRPSGTSPIVTARQVVPSQSPQAV